MANEYNKLFTKEFCLVTASSFFVSWSLYIAITIFPIFLIDELAISGTTAGIILALFPFGALLCRPLAGWLSDSFPKKKTALLAIFAFLISGFGYFFLENALLLGLCRLFQGFTFSIASTTLSTIVLEVIPENRLGSGVGIYSTNYSLAMIIGPMAGFFTLDIFEASSNKFHAVFWLAIFACVLSIFMLVVLKTKPRLDLRKVPFNKDSIILKTGLSTTFSLACVAFLYGLLLNYVALFTKSIGFEHLSSLFFLFMGGGLILSRMVSGYIFDKGYVYIETVVANIAIIIVTILFINVSSELLYFVYAFVMGFCYGAVIPTFQTLLVKFAKENERGLASSTYFIAFDIGTMFALFGGGVIIDMLSIEAAYYAGVILQVIWLFVFIFYVMPEYRNKVSEKNSVDIQA